jgi:hypothetical protein
MLDTNYPEPLYKLGQTYVRLGRPEDAKKIFARHRDVMTRAETGLYHRSGEIQSFILKLWGMPSNTTTQTTNGDDSCLRESRERLFR